MPEQLYLGEMPVINLETVKNAIIGHVNYLRDFKIQDGFNFELNGTIYRIQSKQSDRENVLGLSIAARAAIDSGSLPNDLRWLSPTQDFYFITADNITVPMDAQTVISLYNCAIQYKTTHTLYARYVKDQILAAETLETLETTKSALISAWPE